MSKELVIKIENLSKIYRLGQVGTGTISHDLNRFWHRIRNKNDPYTKIAQTNHRQNKNDSNYVFALNKINLNVYKGDVVGVIGKNGAGKSTLLKIISRVTTPSEGSIKGKGKIASLLEVGTGMHQEMTARENIFLNGLILGMKKSEIESKFHEIIEFSGCRMYVDTPIKRFSSGMRVRLGFAVAAFLTPDILIIDEILAVGDAEFQKKAVDRIKSINNNKDRTIFFVSHNLASVSSICNRGIVIDEGRVCYDGPVDSAISHYTKSLKNNNKKTKLDSNEFIDLISFFIFSSKESIILTDDEIQFLIEFENKFENIELIMRVDIFNLQNVHIKREEIEFYKSSKTKKGKFKLCFTIPSGFLNKGIYNVNIDFIDFQKHSLLNCKNCKSFEVSSVVSDLNISARDMNNAISLIKFEKTIEFNSN